MKELISETMKTAEEIIKILRKYQIVQNHIVIIPIGEYENIADEILQPIDQPDINTNSKKSAEDWLKENYVEQLIFANIEFLASMCESYHKFASQFGQFEQKEKKLVSLNCMFCGNDFEGEEPKMCCSGKDCGCLGQPIEPIVCSKRCYDDLMKKSDKQPVPPQTVIMPSDSECFTKSDKKEKYHLDNMTVKYNKGVPVKFAAMCCGNSFYEGAVWLRSQVKAIDLRNDKILKKFQKEFGTQPTTSLKYRWQGVNWLLEYLTQK